MPPAALYCIYRRANVARVDELIHQARAGGWSVHVWDLDGPAAPAGAARAQAGAAVVAPATTSAVEQATVGGGPGLKFDLLNRMLNERPPRPGDWVVVTDDDVALRSGTLVSFVRVAAASGMELAQPARSTWRQASHPVTYPQPGCVARLTTFVEIGPVFAVAPQRRAEVVPFPDDAGMGWGLDAAWAVSAARDQWKLGVVDCVQVEHPDAIGEGYESRTEAGRSQLALRHAGVDRIEELQHTLSHWWVWQSRAPWLARDGRRTPASPGAER